MGADTLRRLRDYAVDEPSFTVPFAAWELGLSSSLVSLGVAELLKKGIVQEIEPRSGPYAAVYAYDPPTGDGVPSWQPGSKRRLFAELDDARIGELAPPRGVAVPHTHVEGASGKPGHDKRRQVRGVRVKRRRNGT
jgi:hypothetical protein